MLQFIKRGFRNTLNNNNNNSNNERYSLEQQLLEFTLQTPNAGKITCVQIVTSALFGEQKTENNLSTSVENLNKLHTC